MYDLPYKQKIWLKKYLTKSRKHHFGEINLAIQRSHCITKHQPICNWQNKFGDLHKKSPTAKFNSLPNFLLIQYVISLVSTLILPVKYWRVYTKGKACTRCLPVVKRTQKQLIQLNN